MRYFTFGLETKITENFLTTSTALKMSAWKEYKTDELIAKDKLAIGDGYRAKNEELTSSGLPFARAGNINNGFLFKNVDYLPIEYEKKVVEKISKPGDIVFTSKGTVGRFAFVKPTTPKFIYSPQLCYWRSLDTNVIDSSFLYYWMNGFEFFGQVESLKGQTDMADYVNLSDQRKMTITLPPLPEQQAIAAILSALDDKIDLLHRQNATLEAMAEAMFRQWFVVEAREEWEEGTLGDVIEIFDHLRVPLSKMERDLKKDGYLYPYYGASQIMDYVNDYIFDGEYILLGEDGTVRTDEGYPVLQYATGKFWVNNHTHVIKAKAPYSNFFLWTYLKKKNIDEIVTGAVQPKINQGNLKALNFPQFPEGLVKRFNETTEGMFSKIKSNQTQIRTLTTLRDALLPKLMNGELRVKYKIWQKQTHEYNT